jgi:WhiB family transcriptional regulator, redox-sensing transcriptional regulator
VKTSWMEQAACRTPAVDPEVFFPVSESGLAARQVVAAKAICVRCPVTGDCLAWALREEATGIWGGTTTEERRLLRRARQLDGAVL